MANTWFRMYSDAIDDEKLRLLAFEDRWHFVAILCCKNSGILDSDEKLMRRKVAVKLGLDLRELDEVARRLAEVGLIDADTLQPIAWDKRQYVSDGSKERTKRYREKLRESHSDVTVTSHERHNEVTVTPPDTDTDTDTDTDKTLNDPIGSFVGNENQIPDAPHREIITLYAKHLPMGIQPKSWDGARAAALKTRWREGKKRQDLAWWDRFFAYVAKSDFLTGRVTPKNGKPFEIDLPWILKKENFDKIIDGKYDNR